MVDLVDDKLGFSNLDWQSITAQVVLMNQVTTKITAHTAQLAPALGESWSHACTNRIILYWEDNQRMARLVKSPSQKGDTVPFIITEHGIRAPRNMNANANANAYKRKDTRATTSTTTTN